MNDRSAVQKSSSISLQLACRSTPRIAVSASSRGCIEIEQPGMLEQRFLFDGTSESLPDQQIFNPLDRLARCGRGFRSRF